MADPKELTNQELLHTLHTLQTHPMCVGRARLGGVFVAARALLRPAVGATTRRVHTRSGRRRCVLRPCQALHRTAHPIYKSIAELMYPKGAKCLISLRTIRYLRAGGVGTGLTWNIF
jgi:hypothetical protein